MALRRPLAVSSGGAAEVPDGDTTIGFVQAVGFTQGGVLTATVTGKSKWVVPAGNWVIVSVTISLGVASSSGAVTADVNVNGTTAYTTQGNRPSLAASATTGTATLPDVTALSGGDYLTVDVDAFGTGADTVTVGVHYVRVS